MNSKFRFLGKEQDLNSVKSLMKETNFNDALNKFVDNDFIRQALDQETVDLDQVKLPKQLPYYINRTLIWKRRLNPLIFREACPDVFVFEDIKRRHISMLATPNLPDTSGSQLDDLNVRFILLECEVDFKEILKQADVPVHRIYCKEDLFYWKFTAGSLQVIRSFLLDDESEEITEQALVEDLLAAFSSRPLAIVSSPVMGQSVLLGSIAHRLQDKFTERIVLFLEIRSIFQYIKNTSEKKLV